MGGGSQKVPLFTRFQTSLLVTVIIVVPGVLLLGVLDWVMPQYYIVDVVLAALLSGLLALNIFKIKAKKRARTPTEVQCDIPVYDSGVYGVSERALCQLLSLFKPDKETGEIRAKLTTVARKHLALLIIRWVWMLIATLALEVPAALLAIAGRGAPWWSVVAPICFGGLLAFVVYVFWCSWYLVNDSYFLHEIRIYPVYIWWLSEENSTMEIKDTTVISSKVPWWAKVLGLNLGKVKCGSASQEDTAFNDIKGLPHPDDIAEDIRSAQGNRRRPTESKARLAFQGLGPSQGGLAPEGAGRTDTNPGWGWRG